MVRSGLSYEDLADNDLIKPASFFKSIADEVIRNNDEIYDKVIDNLSDRYVKIIIKEVYEACYKVAKEGAYGKDNMVIKLEAFTDEEIKNAFKLVSPDCSIPMSRTRLNKNLVKQLHKKVQLAFPEDALDSVKIFGMRFQDSDVIPNNIDCNFCFRFAFSS